MAVVAYDRLRMLWGALDWQHGSNNPYATSQTAAGGDSAAAGPGNIGVRRSVLVVDRAGYTPADDDMLFHFDWLNITGGNPDDTWTTGDYTGQEGRLQTFFTSISTIIDPLAKLREIRWYRHGPGVTAPNPAERVFILPTPIAGGGGSTKHPPQVACTVTFRTAVRHSWGRTYLPATAINCDANLRVPSSTVDSLVTATDALVTSSAAADFRLVVTSIPKSAALNVEHVEVDSTLDIIRRRRWKHTTYKKITPP